MNDRAQRLFEQTFEKIQDSPDVGQSLHIVSQAYNLAHITYHFAQTVAGRVDSPFVRTTYPSEWVARYLLKGYVAHDPIVLEGFARTLPFDWREVEATEKALEIMIDAAKYGLGGSGFSVPVIDKHRRRALVSFNSTHKEDEWSQFTFTHKTHLVEISHCLHRKAIVELYGNTDPIPQLAPREIECLTWAALGKDHKAIAILLDISEHTVKDYLKSARYKLDCANISQAVAKAIKLRLITP